VKDYNQHAPTIHGDKSTAAIEITSTKQASKATKKAPRARRKLCLDEELDALEVQQNNAQVRSGGMEDTFIFGFTPKNRQPKTKTEDGAVSDAPKQKKKTAPKAKKATKAKKQLEDKLEPEPDHASEPAVQIEEPEKKAKTARKKIVASKSTASIATGVNDTSKSPINNGADRGSDDSGGFFTAAEDLPEETVTTKPKPAKAKPASKRAPKRSVDEVATVVDDMNSATPERPTKRPRRQAAISAIEKVAMGYENDLIPVDKLRRGPEVESKPRRSRKADVLESSATALLSPPLTAQADSVIKDVQDCEENQPPSSPPLVVKRGRKPGVKKGRTCKPDEQLEVVELMSSKHLSPTREGNHAPADEPPLAPKPPAKRGRKPGVKTTKGLADTAGQRQEVLRPQPAEQSSPTKEDSRVPHDEQPLLPKLPAKRGRKPGSKNRKIVAATDREELIMAQAATELVSNQCSPAKNEYTPDDEPMLSPKLPAKRGRKPGITIAKRRACELDEETEASKPTSTKCLSPTTDDERTPEDQPPLPAKILAKRGRPPGVKNRTVDAATIRMESTAGPTARSIAGPTAGRSVTQLAPQEDASTRTKPKYSTDTDSRAQATKVPRHGTSGEIERPLAKQPARGSSRNTVEEQPTKQRRALADFDGNIVRKSLTVEGKKILPPAVDAVNPATNQRNKPRKTKTQLAAQSDPRLNAIRADETQVLPQHEHSPNEGSSHETTTTPKRRHVIATEEDLDWLFEKPQSRRPKPAATRHPATKTRHMAPDQCAKDMDLDDLLATVDGLAGGELLTGRRRRVVAS
jgi:hypothetical protein